jgi:Rps23 Pro-64 3,4-dihydroxylase Tpa1-like proline 4-hydroxylase
MLSCPPPRDLKPKSLSNHFTRSQTSSTQSWDAPPCLASAFALQGGHLLNHDDVISTRAVSFIIYLTDPDEPWTAEDGGALELYPLVEGETHVLSLAVYCSVGGRGGQYLKTQMSPAEDGGTLELYPLVEGKAHISCAILCCVLFVASVCSGGRGRGMSCSMLQQSSSIHLSAKHLVLLSGPHSSCYCCCCCCCTGQAHTPDVIPTVSHLPAWNTMAMFVVQPGRSFHSVQVVGGGVWHPRGTLCVGVWGNKGWVWVCGGGGVKRHGHESSIRLSIACGCSRTWGTTHSPSSSQNIKTPVVFCPFLLPLAPQEVVSADKPRFSISGWYHRDVPQEGSAHASLQQLQMKAGEDQIQGHTDFEGEWKLSYSVSLKSVL